MLTRTTSSSMSSSLVKYMANTQDKFNKLSTQLATQKKITSITDDAVAAKSILSAKKDINLYNGYIDNMKNAQFELQAVEDTIKGSNQQATRALDIAMMATNGPYSETELNAFKQEVEGIVQNLKTFANTKYSGSYLYAGAATLTQPFELTNSPEQTFKDNGDGTYTKTAADEAGNITTYKMENTGTTESPVWQTTVTNPDSTTETRATTADDWKIENTRNVVYKGSTDTRQIVIGAEGLNETISIIGKDLFGQGSVTSTGVFDPATGVMTSNVESSGDEGLLSSITKLASALEIGDTDAMRDAMKGIQTGIEHIAESRTNVGLTLNRFDTLTEAYDNNITNLTALRSSLEDADLTSLIAEWLQSQYALEASYSLSSQMMGISIMNYI